MKNRISISTRLAVMGAMVAGLSALQVTAQEAPKATPAAKSAETATASQPVALSPGVVDVLKLVRAKTGDEVVIAFVNKSTATYNLGASEIIYLREQGVSDAVLSVMLLKQSSKAPVATAPVWAPAAPAPVAAEPAAPAPPASANVAPAQPATTYVPPAPVYVQPQTVYVSPPAPAYYYPSYGYYPPVSLSFGFGLGSYYGGYHGGYHGGYGGYHGGGVYHGGHR
jgi:hypothetical protein